MNPSWFSLLFSPAGIFMMLTIVGIVPVSNADEQTGVAWILLIVMSVAFTTVGGGLVFGDDGRSSTARSAR